MPVVRTQPQLPGIEGVGVDVPCASAPLNSQWLQSSQPALFANVRRDNWILF